MTTPTKVATKNAKNKTQKVEEQKEFIIGPNKVTALTKLKYKANPKRENSQAWLRYETYQKAKTFGEYQKLNMDRQSIPDLKHDFIKGFVEITG